MKPEKPNPIKLSPSRISGLEEKYVSEAINNNELSYHGSFISDIENYFESYFEGKKTIALNSGTSAIHLALIMAGVQRGDEVLCQSFTYAATAFPINYLGATPVFIGSEEDSWNMCPETLEIAIKERIRVNKKPKAVVVVHSYGMPCKIEALSEVASKYEITLIEDAAEALGSKIKNTACGSFGEYGILSFNTNKLITSAGGGLLICNTKKEKDKAQYLAAQAKSGISEYHHEFIGYNYKMNNINAAILKAQLTELHKVLDAKRETHNWYSRLFEDNSNIILQKEYCKTKVSNFWLHCIVCEEQSLKAHLIEKLNKNHIEYRDLWKPLHLQPVYKNSMYYGNDLAEKLYHTGICLPSGTSLSSEELERIKEVFTSLP